MQVTGEYLFHGPRPAVWALLNDEEVLRRCTPGCERLEQTGDDQYRAHLKIGLAAVKGTYEGSLHITDKQAPETMTLKIEAAGSTGFVNVGGRMDLHDLGDRTRVAYDWNVAVGGPVAMVGQRILGGVAKWIIGDFFNTAHKELTVRLKEGAV